MEKPTKIILTIPFFYPHKGGAQKYAEELFTHVKKAHPQTQIDVLCYNTDRTASFEIYRGLNIFRVPCYQIIRGKFVFPKLIPLISTLRHLAKQKYDFVNSHTAFFDTTWWAWIFARKIGAKSIFTGHAPGHPTHHTKIIEVLGRFVHLTLGRWAVKHYDICTYANTTSKTFFESTMGATHNAKVVPISVDSTLFNTDNTKKFGGNEITVTYVGRMIETKGLVYLLEAILMLRDRLSTDIWNKLKFTLAGGGALMNRLEVMVSAHDLVEKFTFTGNLEYTQVADLLKRTDVFISPSSHPEGLPNTVLEAGACGCVIIATESGSISDIVKDKSTGILVPMKNASAITDALVWVLTHQNEAFLLAKDVSQLILTRFTWGKTSEDFYTFIGAQKS